MTDRQASPHATPDQGSSVVRGAAVSLGVRLLDLPCRYGFHLLVAAALGVADTGRFYIVFSIMVGLAGFGRLGIDQALTRQLAVSVASDQPEAVRPAIRRALGLILLASSAVALLLAALAWPLAHHVLRKEELAVPLALGALTIIPQNLGAGLAGALAGLQRIGYSQMIYSWLWPAVFCVVAIPLMLTGMLTVTATLFLIAASFALTALVGAVLLRSGLVRVSHAGTLAPRVQGLLRPGLSLFTLEVTKLLITSAPAIALGIVATAYETGLFALTWRMALVINILISGVAGMAVPRFAALHARGDIPGMEKAAAQAIGIVLCLALPATAVMLLFPGHLLSLFGPGFGEGATTLRILAVGQLAAACFTAMPEMLGMTSHLRALYRINACTLVVLFAGLMTLVPLAGSAGAALATALATVVNGVAAAWLAHRLLAVSPLSRLRHLVASHLRRRTDGEVQ